MKSNSSRKHHRYMIVCSRRLSIVVSSPHFFCARVSNDNTISYFAVGVNQIQGSRVLFECKINGTRCVSTGPTEVSNCCYCRLFEFQQTSYDYNAHIFVTARKRSLRRLCFYTCLSVHSGWGMRGMGGVRGGRHAWQGDMRGRGRAWQGACVAHMPPPPQIPRDTVNKRAVRILLECILVLALNFHFWSFSGKYEETRVTLIYVTSDLRVTKSFSSSFSSIKFLLFLPYCQS